MFMAAAIAFALTILMTYLVLEITPILSVLVLSLTFSLIGLTIGFSLTSTDSKDYDDDYHRIQRTLVIASGSFALLAAWVGVWAATVTPLEKHLDGDRKKALWTSFACGISVWVIGVSSIIATYFINPGFKEYIDGPSTSSNSSTTVPDEHKAVTVRADQ
jgi:hypothetical protein